MELVDIGANLTHPAFRDDVADVVARGVQLVLLTGGEPLLQAELPELAAGTRQQLARLLPEPRS